MDGFLHRGQAGCVLSLGVLLRAEKVHVEHAFDRLPKHRLELFGFHGLELENVFTVGSHELCAPRTTRLGLQSKRQLQLVCLAFGEREP